MFNLFLSCPPVYHLPGTWTKCEQPLIPHGNLQGLTGDNLIIGAIVLAVFSAVLYGCLLYTSPSPRDVEESRMPSSA